MEVSLLLSTPNTKTPIFFATYGRRRIHLRLQTLRAANTEGEQQHHHYDTTTTSNNKEGMHGNIETSTAVPRSNLGIRYRPRLRKLAREKKQQENRSVPPPKKDWESMTLVEKAVELYVGEKGLLFWLNKLAYASIFVVIGGWIVFRFVGPSLGLYQLDTPPLAPTSIFKG